MAILRDGEPCDHEGCLNHVTHPCEGCGRIAGRFPLKPCPFCGGEARLMRPVQMIYDYPKNGDEWGIVSIYAYCPKCQTKSGGESAPEISSDVGKLTQEVISRWNTRIGDK